MISDEDIRKDFNFDVHQISYVATIDLRCVIDFVCVL